MKAPDARVSITHPERVLWPGEGITKQKLVAYFERVADLLLEELKGRLLTLFRAPDGIESEVFFQKNAPSYLPEWIRTVKVAAPSAKRDVSYIVCESTEALRWIANQSGIELHHTLDRDSKPGRPDLLVFDMDPPEGRFDLAVAAAVEMRELLRQSDLDPAVKTSGGKGLHVYLRLERRYDFREVHGFARGVAEEAVAALGNLLTVEFKKADREGRVFLDIHRNTPGATIVAAFSPRARAGAPVSFPVRWKDIYKVSPLDFSLSSAARLLKSAGVSEWKSFLRQKQRLPRRAVSRA